MVFPCLPWVPLGYPPTCPSAYPSLLENHPTNCSRLITLIWHQWITTLRLSQFWMGYSMLFTILIHKIINPFWAVGCTNLHTTLSPCLDWLWHGQFGSRWVPGGSGWLRLFQVGPHWCVAGRGQPGRCELWKTCLGFGQGVATCPLVWPVERSKPQRSVEKDMGSLNSTNGSA